MGPVLKGQVRRERGSDCAPEKTLRVLALREARDWRYGYGMGHDTI